MKLLLAAKTDRMMQWASRFHGMTREEGGSLIEFALLVPLMMVLITGMFSFGIALNNYTVLTNGVSAGARALALARGQTSPALAGTDPCAYAIQTANSALPSLKSSSITWTIVWTTTNSSGSAVTNTYSNTCSAMSLNAGDNVSVKAVYPYSLIVYGWRPLALNMTNQTTELVQ
jgi:Flp pilus assembly protein TadG